MTTSFAPLGHEECYRLLSQVCLGRVVGTTCALPLVAAVTFVLDGHGIVFRTTPGSDLAAATDGSVVAFEADDIDPVTRTGWSVVVTGVAHPISEDSELLRATQLGLAGWSTDDQHWVRIAPGIVTGRRLSDPVRLLPTGTSYDALAAS